MQRNQELHYQGQQINKNGVPVIPFMNAHNPGVANIFHTINQTYLYVYKTPNEKLINKSKFHIRE